MQSHAKRKVHRGRTSLDWVAGFKVRGAGPGVGSEPTPTPLCGWGCLGNPTPVTCALKEPLWLGSGEGMGMGLTQHCQLDFFLKKKKKAEKSNTCQQRQLWSLTVHRKGCPGDRWGGDTNQVPSKLPFLCTQTAESGVTPGCPHSAPPSVSPSARWTAQGVGVRDGKVSEVPRISSWVLSIFCISDGGVVRFQALVPGSEGLGTWPGTSSFWVNPSR